MKYKIEKDFPSFPEGTFKMENAGKGYAGTWEDEPSENHNKPISTEWEKEFDALVTKKVALPVQYGGKSATMTSESIDLEDIKSFIRNLLTTQQTAHEDALKDKDRLDFLDKCNQALNAHFGTTYGWELILNHNVTRLMSGKARAGDIDIDLNDAKAHGAKSCREVIDAQMQKLSNKDVT